MKTKLFLISILTLLLVSCEEKEWQQSDISLVPVFQVDYVNSDMALEIYKEKPLLLEYSTSTLVSAYTLNDLSDQSTDSLYLISFNRMDSMMVDSAMAQVSKYFDIQASIATDTGIMNITYVYNNLDTVAASQVDITIQDTEVYN